MRPRGESISVPSARYVGHWSRHSPQCTHREYNSHVGFSCAEKFEWGVSMVVGAVLKRSPSRARRCSDRAPASPRACSRNSQELSARDSPPRLILMPASANEFVQRFDHSVRRIGVSDFGCSRVPPACDRLPTRPIAANSRLLPSASPSSNSTMASVTLRRRHDLHLHSGANIAPASIHVVQAHPESPRSPATSCSRCLRPTPA